MQGGILAAASIISRIIGMLYRLPVTNIIGDQGNSYYSAAYEVYNIILLISSYSLPLAMPGGLLRPPCICRLWWELWLLPLPFLEPAFSRERF